MPGEIKPKTPEELANQVAAVSSILQENIAPQYNPSSLVNQSDQNLKTQYPERYNSYLKLLRLMRTSVSPQQQDSIIQESKRKIGALNNVQNYIISHKEASEGQTLKERQLTVYEDLYRFLEAGNKEGYVKLPTGSGKTVIFIELIGAMRLKTLVVVPTTTLIYQTKKRFSEFAPTLDVGVVDGTNKQLGTDVTVTTYDSLLLGIKSGLIKQSDFDLLVLDEVHMSLSDLRMEAVQSFTSAIKVGFTATPAYSESKKVSNLLATEIHEMSIEEAVHEGMLCPFQVYLAKTKIDLSKVTVTADGDYSPEKLEKAVNTEKLNLAAVQLVKEYFYDKSCIAYCATIKHAHDLAEAFKKQGITAGFISGHQSVKRQQEVLNDHLSGKIQVICNADILITGYDNTKVSVGLHLRPTLSPVLAEQRGGRLLRTDQDNPEKIAYIIDFIDDNRSTSTQPISFADIAGSAKITGPNHLNSSASTGSKQPTTNPDIRISGLEVVTDPKLVYQSLQMGKSFAGKEGVALGQVSVLEIQKSLNIPLHMIVEVFRIYQVAARQFGISDIGQLIRNIKGVSTSKELEKFNIPVEFANFLLVEDVFARCVSTELVKENFQFLLRDLNAVLKYSKKYPEVSEPLKELTTIANQLNVISHSDGSAQRFELFQKAIAIISSLTLYCQDTRIGTQFNNFNEINSELKKAGAMLLDYSNHLESYKKKFRSMIQAGESKEVVRFLSKDTAEKRAALDTFFPEKSSSVEETAQRVQSWLLFSPNSPINCRNTVLSISRTLSVIEQDFVELKPINQTFTGKILRYFDQLKTSKVGTQVDEKMYVLYMETLRKLLDTSQLILSGKISRHYLRLQVALPELKVLRSNVAQYNNKLGFIANGTIKRAAQDSQLLATIQNEVQTLDYSDYLKKAIANIKEVEF